MPPIEKLQRTRDRLVSLLRETSQDLEDLKAAIDEHAIMSISEVPQDDSDTCGKILYVNDAFCRLTQFPQDALIGQCLGILNSGHHEVSFFQAMWDTVKRGEAWQGEIKDKGRYGNYFWTQATVIPLYNGDHDLDRCLMLRTNITRRVEAEEQAAAANQAKSEFLAKMSHEIRTPMTAISGFFDMLSESSLNNQQSEIVHRGVQATENLMVIINDILDLAKIESGKLDVEMIGFNLHELIDSVSSLFMDRASNKGINWHVETIGNVPQWLESDPHRLRQVLINLIGNSIKFTSSGLVSLIIRIETTELGCSVEFTVKDTGIGMSPEMIGQLFTAFNQVDNSISRRFGGTGLGLAISQQLVRMLGGDIEVRSQLDEGSQFSFVLQMKDLSDNYKPIVRDYAVLPEFSGKVLLVEDTPDIQFLVRWMLEKTGVSVCVAENGSVGVDEAAKTDYDVILMDMQMPVMDGLTATRVLRQNGCEVPVVALTANVSVEDRDNFLQAGCHDFVGKPIDRAELYAVIEPYLSVSLSLNSSENEVSFQMEDEVYQIFIDTLEVNALQIKHSWQAGDWVLLQQAVHSLKGTGGSFGHPELSDLCRMLENEVKMQQREKADPLVKDLLAAAEKIQDIWKNRE
jgi:PAS domain S-box-containing protein